MWDLKVSYQQGDLYATPRLRERTETRPRGGAAVAVTTEGRRDTDHTQSRARTHHAVVVDELQLVVGQDVAPVVDQVQRHLRGGHARLAAGPTAAHGEEGADVQLLLPCARPRPEEEEQEEEKGGERRPQEPGQARGAPGKGRHRLRGRAGPSRTGPSTAEPSLALGVS